MIRLDLTTKPTVRLPLTRTKAAREKEDLPVDKHRNLNSLIKLKPRRQTL